jgi:hypothetical protein
LRYFRKEACVPCPLIRLAEQCLGPIGDRINGNAIKGEQLPGGGGGFATFPGEEGLGRERDLARAIDWYQKSSRQGYGVASNNLATIYGMAAEVDLEQVTHWRSLAREQGFGHGLEV